MDNKISEGELRIGKLTKSLIGSQVAEHLLGRALTEEDLLKLYSAQVVKDAKKWRDEALGEVREGRPLNLMDLLFYTLFEALAGYTTTSLLLDHVQELLPADAVLDFMAAVPQLVKENGERMEQVLA